MHVPWRVDFLTPEVFAELNDCPDDVVASFSRIARLIIAHGLEKVREPYVKHLQGKLWEMRLKGRDGIARAIYVTASGQRIIVVRVFVKKTQKTPPSEIDLALKRARHLQ